LTGSNWMNWRTQAIVKAIGEAGKSLRSSEIAELTGMHYTAVGKYINWNMRNVWVQVAHEETNPRNYHIVKYYGLTPRGAAKLEELK